jgi:hypothetical protein
MKRALLVLLMVAIMLVGLAMPVAARKADTPLVPPVEQPEGTIRLTGELFAWPVSVWDLYRHGMLDYSITYYCLLDGVYRRVDLGQANIYREGGHFYYWLDVLPDDPDTERLEGPNPAGVGANFAYKWGLWIRAQNLGKPFDQFLKYTPDPDPQGALPRVVWQDLHLRAFWD